MPCLPCVLASKPETLCAANPDYRHNHFLTCPLPAPSLYMYIELPHLDAQPTINSTYSRFTMKFNRKRRACNTAPGLISAPLALPLHAGTGATDIAHEDLLLGGVGEIFKERKVAVSPGGRGYFQR